LGPESRQRDDAAPLPVRARRDEAARLHVVEHAAGALRRMAAAGAGDRRVRGARRILDRGTGEKKEDALHLLRNLGRKRGGRVPGRPRGTGAVDAGPRHREATAERGEVDLVAGGALTPAADKEVLI